MNSNILFVLLFTSVALVAIRAIWKGIYSYRRLRMDLEVEKLLRRSSDKELHRTKGTLDDKYSEEFQALLKENRERKVFDPTPYLRN